jgi:arylsulfatase A-like enzyme
MYLAVRLAIFCSIATIPLCALGDDSAVEYGDDSAVEYGDDSAVEYGDESRPNILLIMADDIGFSDIGCFGGEIETPHLDQLGHGGMRFTQAYNMAKCSPTRSAIMTGVFMGGADSPCQPLGDLMRQAGYQTLYSGKEHFDAWVPKERAKAMFSFDKSFCHYGGAGPFFSYQPIPFHLNERKLTHEEVEATTSKPYYKTNAITDYALRFLDETAGDDRPFFLYVAYETAHYPIHTLPEDFEKFRGRYSRDWEQIRRERYAKQQELGIISPAAKLAPFENERGPMPAWDSLTPEEQDEMDLLMAGYAGMIHCLDRSVGRLVDKIAELGDRDNTLILFLSDNGACPFPRDKNKLPPTDPQSYRSINPMWACVGNTPYRLFKRNGHAGGCRTHLIANWPGRIESGVIYREPVHVVDFMPTLLELADSEYPEVFQGQPTPKLDGLSLTPVFRGESRPAHEILVSGWMESKRMIRQGDWKAVIAGKEWELYNITKDPTELDDLAQAMPEKLMQLRESYAQWRAQRPYLPEFQNRALPEETVQ